MPNVIHMNAYYFYHIILINTERSFSKLFLKTKNKREVSFSQDKEHHVINLQCVSFKVLKSYKRVHK